MQEKLRILTVPQRRPIRPALLSRRSARVGSVIKKRRKKMRKHKKKKLLKRSRHKRK
jgi:mRNA-processing protein COX24